MSQVGRQQDGPVYSFSSRRFALLGLAILAAFDAYDLYLFVRIGFLIASYDLWGILTATALSVAIVYFAYGVIVPTRMDFYEGFVRIGSAWGGEAKDIQYFTVSKITVSPVHRRGAGMTEVIGYTVRFYVAGQKNPRIIPSQGRLDRDQKFVDWLRQRCPSSQQEAIAN